MRPFSSCKLYEWVPDPVEAVVIHTIDNAWKSYKASLGSLNTAIANLNDPSHLKQEKNLYGRYRKAMATYKHARNNWEEVYAS